MTPEIAPICLLFEDCIFEASDVSELSVASAAAPPPHPSAKAKIKTQGVISWRRSGVFVPVVFVLVSGEAERRLPLPVPGSTGGLGCH